MRPLTRPTSEFQPTWSPILNVLTIGGFPAANGLFDRSRSPAYAPSWHASLDGCDHSMPGEFQIHSNGDRIARRECLFQRLVEESVQMSDPRWQRLAQTLRGVHDPGALSRLSLEY